MTQLIGIFFLFSGMAHAAPLSWPNLAIQKIQSAKSVKDLACVSHDSRAGVELCAAFKASYAEKANVKIERVSDSVLSIKVGPGSYKLERTEAPLRFLLNDRMIDLNKYPNQERLGFAVEAALSAHSASTFDLIKRAYAASPVDPAVAASAQGLLVIVGQSGNCEAYKKLVDTCTQNLDPILAYIKGAKPADQAKVNRAVKEKIDALSKQLTTADASINVQYGYALNCDCKENANQVSCSEQAKKALWGQLPMRDEKNMTVPRQKGMDVCQRFLQQVIQATTLFDVRTKALAEKILSEVDENVNKIKAETPADAGTSH